MTPRQELIKRLFDEGKITFEEAMHLTENQNVPWINIPAVPSPIAWPNVPQYPITPGPIWIDPSHRPLRVTSTTGTKAIN